MSKGINIFISAILIVLMNIPSLNAQYFGRNKPRYETFDFKVYETEHFEIYHYLDNNKPLLDKLAVQAERWYDLHSHVLKDTIKTKNPLIFYNNHADFQQTNTISGLVGAGTGGVTEGLKNRVIMPIALSNQQTHHVLGHELVHAFHYNIMINGDSTNLANIQNVPLWFIEGMAEYMSIGRVDPHTSMWMRDAVLNNDIPAIRDLSDYGKYFPYRFGQAFLAFLTGTYGDDIIKPLYVEAGKYGLDVAFERVLGIKTKDLSELWVQSIKRGYAPWLEGKKERAAGKALISDKDGGMNVSPVISPNGQFMIFLTQKNVFTTDLYLADARSGEIIRSIASTSRESDIDDFNYLESAGTWSPDSKKFAFVAFKKGQNVLIIKNVDRGKTDEEIKIPGVTAFSNPAWSPDGNSIIVSGMVNGQTDLFLYTFRNKKVKQLTNDVYSELHPSWSPDGKEIYFSTDQLSYDGLRSRGNFTFNIASIKMESGETRIFEWLFGADNLNPIVDESGNIFFLSDRDGFRNIYRYSQNEKQLYQITELLTGVSGITKFSPAISLAGKRSRLVYSHFYNRSYNIHGIAGEALEGKPTDATVNMDAAILPPGRPGKADKVVPGIAYVGNANKMESEAHADKPYRSKFKLDYVGGGTGLGMGSANAFGANTGLAGGVDMLFSDILGNNFVYTGLSMNGEIYDIGGQIMYQNRKRKLGWGASVSHIPFRSGYFVPRGEVILEDNAGNQILTQQFDLYQDRIYQDQLNLIFQLPLSVTKRIEFGGGYAMYYQRRDLTKNYYDLFGRLIHQERERLEAPAGLNMFSANAAFVGDNSYFGIASPMLGHRYRVGVEAFAGDLNFMTALVDVRKYHFWKPVNMSYRILHFSRYGKDADNLFRLFPIDPMMVRGFNRYTLDQFEIENGLNLNQISGSKMLVANYEIRLPFTGPKQLALINSKFLFTELAWFVDAGLAWSDFRSFSDENQARPAILASTGLSLRVNVFGALILEPFYAFPVINGAFQKGSFGVNIIPGW